MEKNFKYLILFILSLVILFGYYFSIRDIGRYQMTASDGIIFIMDTKTGAVKNFSMAHVSKYGSKYKELPSSEEN